MIFPPFILSDCHIDAGNNNLFQPSRKIAGGASAYALLPGFRYITDDRYNKLTDEMKDIVRTG